MAQITIMLVRSRAGKTPAQRQCLDALGLKRREVKKTLIRPPFVASSIKSRTW